MGLFDNFPYGNTHELNLDWILEKINGVTGKVADAENAEKKSAEHLATVQRYAKEVEEEADSVRSFYHTFVPKYVEVEEIDSDAKTQLKGIYSELADRSTARAFVNILAAKQNDLLGGCWNVEIFKASNSYGYIEATRYPFFTTAFGKVSPLVKKVLTLHNGVWDSDWRSMSTESGLTLLWRNESPTSTFPPCEIVVDRAHHFETLYVGFRHSTGHTTFQKIALRDIGFGVVQYPAANVNGVNIDNVYRYVNKTSSNNISFCNGYRNGAVDNGVAIPVEIYGSTS